MVPFERAMVVSYRLYTVTIALSVTMRPQFAVVCLPNTQINRESVTLGIILYHILNPLTPTAAIRHPVPDLVKPSFVIFDIHAL